MKKTLISAAVLSATLSAASYASQSGDAIRAYDEANEYEVPAALAMVPDTVFDTVAQGEAAPIDSRIATVVSIPGALAAACTGGDPSCAASFPDIVVGAATSVSDPSDVGGGEAPSNPIEGERTEAPLNISGTVAPSQDACSVQMPASVDFAFAIDRAAVDAIAAGSPKTFDSTGTVSVNFTCGEDRSENLVVSFSTVDDNANKVSTVETNFTSNYHATNGDTSTLSAAILFDDGSAASTDKTLGSTAEQSVSLKAQVTLDDAQAKGGSFESSDATLYVYLN